MDTGELPVPLPRAQPKGSFFMTKARLSGLLAGLVFALLVALPLRAAEATSQTYVVLVGISQYTDEQIKPRPHAEADAKALYDLFIDKDYLGVDAEHVRLLLGSPDAQRKSEPATRENIIKALRWIGAQAKRDDVVLFAFIGQGAPMGGSGSRLSYLAVDSTLKDRAKSSVAAGDIEQELDQLKSERFCAFIDVNFRGYKRGPETVPEPTLGTAFFKEFRGVAHKEDDTSAPGRVVFLATNGLSQSLDAEQHGIFTQALLEGLKGAADKRGYEPDGLVTVEELWDYLDKQIPQEARKLGKVDEEKKQTPHLLESIGGDFVLTHNPGVTSKVTERLDKLRQLAKDGKISSEWAAEGQPLLQRMPKLNTYQDLRRQYQRLVDGALTIEEFGKERTKTLAALKLKRSTAFAFAAKIIQSTQIIREGYVKEVNQGDMVAWAIRGLYRQIDEKLPAEVRERLDKIRDLSEAELTALLADIRERLGQREDLDNHKDIDFALQRMLAHLDPYTTYIDPETIARFTTETTGEFKGIGISIRENRLKGMLQVVTPLKDSPAYSAGLKAGDLIASITRYEDDKGQSLPEPEVISTKGMTTSDAVKKIQGKPGTKVKLTVERDGVAEPLQFEVRRAVIEVESVMGVKRKDNDEWTYILDPESKIAYIRLTGFARNTARDLGRVMKKLSAQNISGLILDLRFNPGGLLSSAVQISDLFIDDGKIVTIRPRAGREQTERGHHDGSLLDFPMVCLVNGMSASGSEIVAACLQDHERAIIMGERSYGKGSVQNIQPFEGGELKLTTASFWRPNGKNLNKSSTSGKEEEEWGVTPNKGFSLKLSEREHDQLYEHQHDTEVIARRDAPAKEKKTEFKDRQLDMALEYLRGQIKTAAKATP
jgi:carboxyl-terminal processing protease